ncbi:G-protein coupled receptor 157-like [Oculina patagonica]
MAITSTPTQTPTTLGFGPVGNTTLNRTLMTITSAFSLFGALVIVVTYITWKDIRTTSRKILVYISIADCVVVGSYLFGTFLPPNTDSAACIAQSFLSTTANLWSFFWTTFMAIFLYTTVARQKPRTAEKMFWAFHVIGWGVPVVIVGMALKEDVLGNDRNIYSSGWCWIKVQDRGKNVQKNIMWMLITGKAWEVVVFVLVLIFYGLLKLHIRQEVYRNERQKITSPSLEAAKKADKKLTFVPLVLLFLRFWGMLRFCIYLTSSMDESESTRKAQHILLYFQGVFESAQGFANFLLFCLFTEKFQENLRRVIHRHFPCVDSRTNIPGERSYHSSSGDSTVSGECSEMNETSSLFRTSDFKANYQTTSY